MLTEYEEAVHKAKAEQREADAQLVDTIASVNQAIPEVAILCADIAARIRSGTRKAEQP